MIIEDMELKYKNKIEQIKTSYENKFEKLKQTNEKQQFEKRIEQLT